MLQRFLKLFLPLSLFIIVVAICLYQYKRSETLGILEVRARGVVKMGRQMLYEQTKPVVDDLLFLKYHSEEIVRIAGDDREIIRQLQSAYFNFSRSHDRYDQIRFFDTIGNEVVRINNSNGSVLIVDGDELQNKQKRYYYRDTMKLDEGQIYMSPLDLNIEHGKIELPWKPMIRLGMVTFSEKGQKNGAIVVNFKAKILLDKLRDWAQQQKGDLMLLNRDGYWLLGRSEAEEWGFMFPDKKEVRFQAWKKNLWEQTVSVDDSGQVLQHSGLFTFETVYPLCDTLISSTGSGDAFGQSEAQLYGGDYQWKMVFFISQQVLNGYFVTVRNYIAGGMFFLLAVVAMFSFFLGRSQQRKYLADQRLKRSNELLEETVQERTAELSWRNKQLSEEVEIRKRAEEKLQLSEERYRSILNAMEDDVYINDADYRIKYANPALMKRIGEDCVGNFCYELLYGRTSPCPWCLLPNILEGKSVSYELKSPKSDKIYHISNSPIRFVGNSVAKMTIARDVTDYRQTQENLANSERRYSTLLETMREALLIQNKENVIVHCNARFSEMLGYSTEEIIGKHVLDFIADEERSIMQLELEKREGQVTDQYELKWSRSDGRQVLTSISPALWKDENGQVLGSFGLITDITSEREQQLKRRSLELQLQQAQKMEALGTLSGGIAHDFNNILSAVIGYAELARKSLIEMSHKGPVLDDIEEILKAGNRATQLVRQILAFSRGTKEEKQPMEIVPIVKEAMKLMKAATSSSIAITFEEGGDLGHIVAEPTQIHQIVMNLCTNACQAMAQGGELRVAIDRITFAAETADAHGLHHQDTVCLSVSDTGTGIPEELREKIFDPFFTTKEVGKGTGLGLAMVYSIVEDLGGHIKVESSVGTGTTFKIFLPISQEISCDRPVVSDRIITGHGEHIIWVDDEAPLVSLGYRMLSSLGYFAIGCSSPSECIAEVKQDKNISLIITDYNMPEMNGLELRETIKRIAPEIPFILCSGFSENVSGDIRRYGIHSYLRKPVRKHDIAVAIYTALHGDPSGSDMNLH